MKSPISFEYNKFTYIYKHLILNKNYNRTLTWVFILSNLFVWIYLFFRKNIIQNTRRVLKFIVKYQTTWTIGQSKSNWYKSAIVPRHLYTRILTHFEMVIDQKQQNACIYLLSSESYKAVTWDPLIIMKCMHMYVCLLFNVWTNIIIITIIIVIIKS